MARRPNRGGKISGLVPVAGGFSQSVSAGTPRDPVTGKPGKRIQFRLKIAIDESLGSPEQRRALALSRLTDLLAMRNALVAVDRGAEAEYLLRKAGLVASDAEKFNFALAAANVVLSRPDEQQSEARAKYSTWGQLATSWANQTLALEYPNAGYGKRSGESTDKPRVEFLCKYIGNVPLATFSDDDYWRAMRPARQRSKTDSTFKAYSQVCRRVLKIAVELKIIAGWPLGATCKLPIIAKGSAPEFPFLYPDEYVRLMRCRAVPLRFRVLYGFIIREGLRISEAFRIRWEHLSRLPNGRWLLDVPDTKTGRALNFVLNEGTGEVLDAFRAVLVTPEAPAASLLTVAERRSLGNKLNRERVPAGELSGPFAWLKPSNLNNAAANLRKHIEASGTTRARLLFTQGRLRRVREHDLRSTFVTWCKLGKIDNETISAHTGHESGTMIARYNRSKATIEHLGLPPYLPLDEAFGEHAFGELDEGAGVPLLGMGEPTSDEILQPGGDSANESRTGNRTSAAGAEALPPLPHAAADELGGASTQVAVVASPPPGASLRPARARSGGRVEPHHAAQPTAPARRAAPAIGRPAGQVDEHALGEYHAQGEVPEAVLAAVRGGYWATVGENAWRPCCGACGQLLPSGPGQYSGACPSCGEPWDGSERPAVDDSGDEGGALVYPGPAVSSGKVSGEGASGGSRDPLGITSGAAPLRNGRDAARDALSRPRRTTRGGNRESSGFDAGARGEGRTPIPVGVLEPKSDLVRREPTNPEDLGGEGAPEATGSGLASRAPVTLLEQLRAAARQAVDEDNWPAVKALEPLIEAERVRLSNEAAARRQAEPVRLEVVRARRDGGAK